MIWFTLSIMIFIVWNIYSVCIIAGDGYFELYSEDDIILKIAKIYWYIVLSGFVLSLLFVTSYIIAQPIWCGIKNNDDKVCEKVWSDKE